MGKRTRPPVGPDVPRPGPDRDGPLRERSAAAPFRITGGDLLLMILPWMAALLLAVVISQRIAVNGPAGFSLPRATFFVASAASLSGFETGWAEPAGMTRVHQLVWALLTLWTAALSTAIATAAYAHVSGARWTWRRIWGSTGAFLVSLGLLTMAGGIASGNSLQASAWEACMIPAASGLITPSPQPHEPRLWLYMFPVAIVVALGPFVMWDIAGAVRGRAMSTVSRLTLVAVPGTFLLGLLGVCGTAWLSGGLDQGPQPDPSQEAVAGFLQDLDRGLGSAATATVDARGAAFTDTTVELPTAVRWALVPVILIGGAGGGVGGGLKAVTAAVLVLGVLHALGNGQRPGRTFGIAAVWLVGLAALFAVTFLGLVITLPQLPGDRVALLAAGACSATGISVDAVSAAGADGHVLAAAMLLGRILPWVVLWWSATRGDEPVAVG